MALDREMEKLHRQFVEGLHAPAGHDRGDAEELFRQVAAFASFGFAKSHAAAFARTAYESSFLKLFYPAQFLVGLINAQPMGFYPVEVLVNDTKRHGVAVLPVDINASSYKTTTEWVGPDGQPGPGRRPRRDPGERRAVDRGRAACARRVDPAARATLGRRAGGWGVRLGLHLVKGIGEQHEALLDAELARGPYASLADVVERTELPEEVLERLIRTGAMDSLGRPRRELLWQLREVAGATRADRRPDGPAWRGRDTGGRRAADGPAAAGDRGAATPRAHRVGADRRCLRGARGRRERRRSSAVPRALDRLGAVHQRGARGPAAGPVRVGGLVVTRQHPMTAKGTVFLALEDETGMVNVTLWPDTWERLRAWSGGTRCCSWTASSSARERSSTSSPTTSGRSSRPPTTSAARPTDRRPPDGAGGDAAAGLGAQGDARPRSDEGIAPSASGSARASARDRRLGASPGRRSFARCATRMAPG